MYKILAALLKYIRYRIAELKKKRTAKGSDKICSHVYVAYSCF